MQKRLSKIFIYVSILALSSCNSKFNSGDCLQATDGYIWYISEVSFSKYVARGWQSKYWGLPAKLEHDILDRYIKVLCPTYK